MNINAKGESLKPKSQRLKVVLELAERNEQASMEVLSRKRQYRDQQQEQLEHLQSYHVQYVHDMKKGMAGSQNVSNLQANLQFMNQVDIAIQQQEGVTENAQNAFNLALEEWKALHQKTKGMTDLITRYKNEELLLAEKKAQKQIEDDLQARRLRR